MAPERYDSPTNSCGSCGMPLEKRMNCNGNYILETPEGTYCSFDARRERDSRYPVSEQEILDFEKSFFSQS